MEVDVAIVGGGPAGCSAALVLRGEGRSVAVIAAPNQGEKPTETASPALRSILQSLGADAALSACEPCYGISSNWGRSGTALRPSITNPSGHAWFIHRANFDDSLKTLAIAAGSKWMTTSAESAAFGDSVVAVKTAGGEIVRAKWLVAATGSPIWPARITNQQPFAVDSLVAFWSTVPATLQERLLFIEASESGWWYCCPGNGSRTVVCFVTDPESGGALHLSRAPNWNAHFKTATLSQKLGARECSESIRCAPAGIIALPRRQGPRWVAIGDAGVKLDPLGSSGIIAALESGRRAGEALSQALSGNAAAMDGYSRWSQGLLGEFVRQRAQQYSAESSRRTGAFWQRRIVQQELRSEIAIS